MESCPTCGHAFQTLAGMRQHHTKVHGEPLANRTCKRCGGGFYDEKARRKFCGECNPNAGRLNGNWRGARDVAECERCGDEFEYYPSTKEGVYCSECVREADEFLGTPYADIADAPRVRCECEHCEERFDVLESDYERGNGRFCSRRCLARWTSENRTGEDHHQWLEEGGTYTGRWWSVRRRALRRDQFRCQACRKTVSAMDRNPDVHHIEPVRRFDDPDQAHRLSNVVSLCRSCHRRAEEGEIDVSKLVG